MTPPSDERSARMKSTWRGVFELFTPRKGRRHVDLDLNGPCGGSSNFSINQAAQHLVREGKRNFEGQMASGEIKVQPSA